ncbi:hypothetical protein Fmac_021451 [Flemingia macrophylla]|uniref:Leucine-rich repeat domain, L domain-containing protein n=1 Tax=Flemingia macrophylla TaxID=520843 RepID=A0ABD1LWW7_9FABA
MKGGNTLMSLSCSTRGFNRECPGMLRGGWHEPQSEEIEKIVEEEATNLEAIIIRECPKEFLDATMTYLPNLRNINLRESKKLIELPDLRGVPRLRGLILTGCVEIGHIDPSIGVLKELTVLNLKGCKNLVLDLNIIFGLDSLKELNLSGCSNLLNNRMLKDLKMTEHLENVDKNRSAIQLSTSSIYEILMFPFYFLSSRKHEVSLDVLLPYLCRFPCLRHLDPSFCGLLQIPDAIGNLHSLEVLNLGGNKFVRLPTTIKELTNLCELNLEHCKQLKYLPELPTTKGNTSGEYFIGLYIFNCPNLSEMEHCYDMIFSWMIQIFKMRVLDDDQHLFVNKSNEPFKSAIHIWDPSNFIGQAMSHEGIFNFNVSHNPSCLPFYNSQSENIRPLTSSTTLNLGLVGLVPPNLNQLAMLENLGLHNNSLKGPLPSFNGLSKLKNAFLNSNDFDSIPRDFFQGLQSLQLLAFHYNANLSATAGGCRFPPTLESSAPQLRNLSCMACNLVGPIPVFLGSVASLSVEVILIMRHRLRRMVVIRVRGGGDGGRIGRLKRKQISPV